MTRENPKAGRRAVPMLALSVIVLMAACSHNAERRSFGTFVDDQAAEVKIRDILYSRPEFDERDHIKVEAHNETLLIAGEVSSEKKKQTATEVATGLKSITRVVNELDVMPPQDTSGKLHNSYITSKVNTKLLTSNPIDGSDTSRIKIMTVRGTVYLMGTVSRAEGDAVAEVVRKTGGVEKVVKVFDYMD